MSIVICTYNRADLLTQVLDDLLAQMETNDDYEVIVVDNNSTDQTRELVGSFERKSGRVKYVLETSLGLSHARNRGFKESSGEYVAYIDDDCRVPETWVNEALEVTVSRKAPVFGGPYFPFYISSRPKWYLDKYGTKKIGDSSKWLNDGEFLSGGNIVVRKDILEAIGGFDEALGVAGQKLLVGEETDFQQRFRSKYSEARIYYEPKLLVYHLVRPQKMSLRWITRRRFAEGRYSFYSQTVESRIMHETLFKIKRTLALLINSLRTALMLFLDITWRAAIRDKSHYPYAANYYYEISSREFVSKFGRIFEELSLLWSQSR